MSDVLAAMERPREAADAAHEALRVLLPFMERYPETYGGLGRTIGADVLKYAEAAGIEPDHELLGRTVRALGGEKKDAEDGSAPDDPVIAALMAKVTAIIEEAERTGQLDEAALSELPPELAEQLRTAFAAAMKADGKT